MARTGGDVHGAALPELWRRTIPGAHGHAIASDAGSDCLIVSDGWGIAFASLRLHRLSLTSGETTASLSTRHQPVGAVLVDGSGAWVATSKRLLRLDADDLSMQAAWTKGVVSNVQQLLVADGHVAMGNWRAPTIGLLDPSTTMVKRIRVGTQPVLVAGATELLVVNGFDGGLFAIDPTSRRLVARHATVPTVAAVASGSDIWGIPGGAPVGGQGEPPVWTRPGSAQAVRLFGDVGGLALTGPASALFASAAHRAVWLIVGDRGERLDQLDPDTGRLLGTYEATEGRFRLVDVDGGMAFATAPAAAGEPTATLIAYRLPSSLPT